MTRRRSAPPTPASRATSRAGDRILIDDGKLALIATSVTETDVVCQVLEGGTLSNNKGINLPGVAVSVPAMSEKDKADLRWALKMRVDMIALSFVRTADDIRDVHADHGRGGAAAAGHRQDREAAGGRQPRRDHPRLRRRHGGPRRPRRRDAARGGAAGAEAGLRDRPPPRQAGHRRDPGARVDDREQPPHPRRGLRRRQRGARRRRRADALGRDQRRQARVRRGAHDGADHREHRGPRAAPHPPARHPPELQGRCRHRGRRRDRRAARLQVPHHLHHERRLDPPAVAGAPAHPDAGLHARTRRPAASSR